MLPLPGYTRVFLYVLMIGLPASDIRLCRGIDRRFWSLNVYFLFLLTYLAFPQWSTYALGFFSVFYLTNAHDAVCRALQWPIFKRFGMRLKMLTLQSLWRAPRDAGGCSPASRRHEGRNVTQY